MKPLRNLVFFFILTNCSTMSTSTIQLKKGQVYTHKLRGNPTTGYDWLYEVMPEGIVGIEQTYANNGEQIGSGGVYIFKITGLSKGTAKIIFTYRQPWNPDKNGEKSEMQFQITN